MIPFNPYIVGNPIRTREMFFGREDDFQFVVRKIGAAGANQVLVFCGERRSGKTSILFQILGGRLGERFLPVLVDMQILAGIKEDGHFWRTILKIACDSLGYPGLTPEKLEGGGTQRVEELFESFLHEVERQAPGRILLFLFDEYELIEAKIQDGSLSESTVLYLAGALESPHRVSFIFTGSTNLENRRVSFWKSLLGKSVYRKISYLSAADTARLITEPLKEHLHYPPQVVEAIYRLTGGQPFYTQVICQNLIDHLLEEEREDPREEDLEAIVRGIVDNPLPQMIYSWNSLSDGCKLILSCLGGALEEGSAWAGAAQMLQYARQNRLILPCNRAEMLVLLEEAYHDELLEKREEGVYRFRMDLLRRWVRREHSIWQVAKEVGVRLRGRIPPLLAAVAAALLAAAGLAVWLLVLQPRLAGQAGAAPQAGVEQPGEQPADSGAREIRDVLLLANARPFRVVIDGSLNLTSEGLADEGRIEVPSLPAGPHRFSFHNPSTGEEVAVVSDIAPDNRRVEAAFTQTPEAADRSARAPAAATAPSKGTEAPRQDRAAAEALAAGSLLLSSSPPDARVYLDGQEIGERTPYLFQSLSAGEHRISLRLEGFEEATLTVPIAGGETLKREVVLVESFGEVLFDVRPTAKILLDGAALIETPYVQPVKVRTGRHLVTMVNEALGVKKEREIVVVKGQTVRVVEVLK